VIRWFGRLLLRSVRLLLRSVAILPRSVAAVGLALVGRRDEAATRLLALEVAPGQDEPGREELGSDEPGRDEPGRVEPGRVEPGRDEPGVRRPGGELAASLLLIPVGLITLLVTVFATLDEIRVIFLFWLTDSGTQAPGTWGGPTMRGAWAVHAVVGLLLFPVFVAVLVALTRLAGLVVGRLVAHRPAPRWVLPAIGVADIGAILFLVAFARQL
jgi:hypothetical protein